MKQIKSRGIYYWAKKETNPPAPERTPRTRIPMEQRAEKLGCRRLHASERLLLITRERMEGERGGENRGRKEEAWRETCGEHEEGGRGETNLFWERFTLLPLLICGQLVGYVG